MASSSSPTTNTTTTPGAVFLTGGTGKVASRIAPLLQAAGIPAIIASRSGHAPPGSGYTAVRFDWDDRTTWEPALAASTQKHGGLSAVFLVMPGMLEPGPAAAAFADLARARAGAKRFVLLSASSVEEGGPSMGQVHALLRERGERGEIGWAVIRPTWMQENFATQETHLKSIREEGKVYSASGAGKIPWVSAGDVAAVAFAALTAPEPPNRDFLVLGPELLSYGDIAGILTEVLGREIAHGDISEAELARRHQGFGMPAQYAVILAAMDTAVKNGSEDRLSDVVLQVTGRPPRRFRDFAEENKAVQWIRMSLPDTEYGEQQCKNLSRTFPYMDKATHLIASPLRRTIKTRLQPFSPVVARSTQIVSRPELQDYKVDIELVRKGWTALEWLYSVSESAGDDGLSVVVTHGVFANVRFKDEESLSRRSCGGTRSIGPSSSVIPMTPHLTPVLVETDDSKQRRGAPPDLLVT
ncbi:hypothetical protein DL770_004886 [Monosporascus sp. CRB-9-2]|nr:hypothetical protein DL770_004886 [Monosporascus sp. CRB-9-2]